MSCSEKCRASQSACVPPNQPLVSLILPLVSLSLTNGLKVVDNSIFLNFLSAYQVDLCIRWKDERAAGEAVFVQPPQFMHQNGACIFDVWSPNFSLEHPAKLKFGLLIKFRFAHSCKATLQLLNVVQSNLATPERRARQPCNS